MVIQKKAISPVVATALLLVVAVVAVVGFQSWFITYQSGINTKVEQGSQSGSALTVERLEGTTDAIVYVKNSAAEDVEIESIKVVKDGDPQCTDETPYTANRTTVTTIEMTPSCASELETGSAYDVVMITETGVYSSTQLAR
ncbi:MAG: archaellin/type IV pilin N-terminal domain-containing protein [archaeon]